MFKKLFVVFATVFLLTACGTPSVEKLVKNPELLAKVVSECTMKMSQGKSVDTKECNNAAEATEQISSNMMKGMGRR